MSVHRLATELAPLYDSPEALSKAILAQVSESPEGMRDALIEVLPVYVAAFMTRKRNTTINKRIKPRSAKVTGIRDWYASMLDECLFTESGWQRFADCGPTDFDFAADERVRRSATELARADQYRRIAAAMRKRKAKKLSELPEALLREAFDVAAA